jgi:hypothetical protein
MVITLSIVVVYIFTIFVFLWYNHIVERRQTVVLKQATQATAVVASLFPKVSVNGPTSWHILHSCSRHMLLRFLQNVRKRVLEADDNGNLGLATKSRLKGFLMNGEHHECSSTTAPIADLYPQCTSV